MVKVTKDGKAVDPEELAIMDAVRLLTTGVTFDDGKFTYKGYVQPVILMGTDGRFNRDVAPLNFILEFYEVDGTAGNVVIPLGDVGEVWEIRSISLTSNLGATYNIEDDGIVVSPDAVLGAGATGELTGTNVPVAGGSDIGITAGAAADTWNIRAVRVL